MHPGLLLVIAIFVVTLTAIGLFTKPYWTQERLDEHNKGN